MKQARSETKNILCRNRLGLHNSESFTLISCADCFGYLFPKDPYLYPFGDSLFSKEENSTKRFKANITDKNNVVEICRHLSRKDCYRWKECCMSAAACCQDQINTQRKYQLHFKRRENNDSHVTESTSITKIEYIQDEVNPRMYF